MNLALNFSQVCLCFFPVTLFVPPMVPVLLQILSGVQNPSNLLPPGSVYTLPPNKTVEISIAVGEKHPFHLHGHVFDAMQSAGNSPPNYINLVCMASSAFLLVWLLTGSLNMMWLTLGGQCYV